MVTTALTVLSSVCHLDMTQINREYDSFCSLDIQFNLFIKVLDKKFKCFYYETCPSSLCNHYISIFSSSNGIFIFSFFFIFYVQTHLFREKVKTSVAFYFIFCQKDKEHWVSMVEILCSSLMTTSTSSRATWSTSASTCLCWCSTSIFCVVKMKKMSLLNKSDSFLRFFSSNPNEFQTWAGQVRRL